MFFFAFAGLYSEWTPPGSPIPIKTFALITTDPNAIVLPIHDKMPAILHSDEYDRWLDKKNSFDSVELLIRPYEGDAFVVDPVNQLPSDEGPSLFG